MTNEHIKGIIPNVHSGLFGQKAYNIIVADNGLIIAQLTKQMINEAVKKATEASKEKGEGMLKRMASTMTAGYGLHQKYYSMTSEQIINETEGNFIISNEQIKKIRIKMGQIYEDGKNLPNELRIIWTGGKQKYTFTNITPKQAKDILQQTLGSKVK